jgi:hypothetical protein
MRDSFLFHIVGQDSQQGDYFAQKWSRSQIENSRRPTFRSRDDSTAEVYEGGDRMEVRSFRRSEKPVIQMALQAYPDLMITSSCDNHWL